MTDNKPVPMAEPAMNGIQLCPVCRGKIRQTAEICPHCGAERHFGATKAEIIRFVLIGFAIGLAASVAVRGGLVIGAITTICCVVMAFIIVQSRHGHRWLARR